MAVAVLNSPLLSALEAMSATDAASLGELFLAERAAELLRARDLVESLLAHTVAEAGSRGLAGAGGSTGSWLAGVTEVRLGRADCARLGARAKTVLGLPLLAALHAGGEVSTAFLDAAAAGLRRLPAEAHPSWDALLAGEARDCDPADIAKLLAQFRVMIDPDTVSAAADAAERRSTLHVSPYGSQGAWAVNGTLHGLEGELLARMLDIYSRPTGADNRRSRGERNAAALTQILRVAERAGRDPEFRPAPRGAAGHLVIHATAATWHRQPGAPAATTESGTVVDPGQLQAIRCATDPEVLLNADNTDIGAGAGTGTGAETETVAETDARLVREILAGMLGPEIAVRIEPLAYGRGLRTANWAIWQGLVARDHHCVAPGCDRDPSWCEAHHLQEWDADHGTTDPQNMALVCWQHHTRLHRNNQHLHPPWCTCDPCRQDRRLTYLTHHQWAIRHHPPRYDL